MKKLCEAFNEISVKKGEKFEIELMIDTVHDTSWSLEVISGKPTQLGQMILPAFNATPYCSHVGPLMDKKFFRADEEGTIEFKATESRSGQVSKSHTLIVRVK